MRSPEALATALGMLNCPPVTRRASRSPLPKGVTFLLEVAAGEDEALREATALTGRSEATLRKAAGFFIEQVLLSQGADHYRVLGGSRETSDANLRRHMALIMRWLHPDVVSGGGSATDYFDRRLYAERVTGAWEGIKTKERRAVYDASSRAVSGPIRGSKPVLIPPLFNDAITVGRTQREAERSVKLIKRDGIWSRILFVLTGRL